MSRYSICMSLIPDCLLLVECGMLRKDDIVTVVGVSLCTRKAMFSGLTAGALAQFIASPTDLVKVQMQMEGRRRLEGHSPRVRGTWHTFTTILQQGGARGLWRGWVPNVQRAALVNLGGRLSTR